MMPALYHVYRLAALQGFPHIDDLLNEYENGNELEGWIAYFQQEDERLLKMLKTALSSARGVPTAPVRQEREPVVDMTDPKIQQDFLKFVTGSK